MPDTSRSDSNGDGDMVIRKRVNKTALPGHGQRVEAHTADNKDHHLSVGIPNACLSMSAKRHAYEKARTERYYNKLAWRLGVTPHLLKAVLHSRAHMPA